MEMGKHGQGLERLSQPHFVADDHLVLHQCEPRREALVAAEQAGESAHVQLLVPDGHDDVGREPSLDLRLILCHQPEFGQHGVEVGGARQELVPWVTDHKLGLPRPSGSGRVHRP